MPKDADPQTFTIGDEAYDGDGVMINSRFLDGLSAEEAFETVASRLENDLLNGTPRAERKVNFACATGAFPPALLGLPDPGHSL